MKLEAISAYSVQSEVNKAVVSKETQTTELLSSSPQNFADDVVSLSVTNTNLNLNSGDSVDHNGHGKHPPGLEYQIEFNGHGKHPPE